VGIRAPARPARRWIGSWWLIATLVAAFVLIHYFVVPGEERSLEARFGDEYRRYKAAVRCRL
jgi:protein-S-isoprenylcysteine O-methyltransferase Ste14